MKTDMLRCVTVEELVQLVREPWQQRVAMWRCTTRQVGYDDPSFRSHNPRTLELTAVFLRPSKEKAEALASELRSLNPSQLFVCVAADLTSRESTRALVPGVLEHPDVVGKHAAISILVANAGLGRRIRDIKDIEEDDWDEIMEVNARSQFVVTKACLPGMRHQSWGRVILVGSIASRGGGINGCHYAASKGALR